MAASRPPRSQPWAHASILRSNSSAPSGCCSIPGRRSRWTIRPGVTIRTAGCGETLGTTAGAIVNQGVISAQNASRTITVARPLTNSGTVEARNGGTVTVSGGTSNISNFTLTGGTWAAYAG